MYLQCLEYPRVHLQDPAKVVTAKSQFTERYEQRWDHPIEPRRTERWNGFKEITNVHECLQTRFFESLARCQARQDVWELQYQEDQNQDPYYQLPHRLEEEDSLDSDCIL
jgi:hypothetical protein